jgi:hypothetical protein
MIVRVMDMMSDLQCDMTVTYARHISDRMLLRLLVALVVCCLPLLLLSVPSRPLAHKLSMMQQEALVTMRNCIIM